MEGVAKVRAASLEAAKEKLEHDYLRGKGVWMTEESSTLKFLD
jgi:hypothetical protein